MATIALDATYSVDPQPSGTVIHSRRLIEHLLTLDTPHCFLVCYRLSRFSRRRDFLRPSAVPNSRPFRVRLFQEPLTFWLPWQAEVFHSLGQRPPAFHFRKEIVTIHDIFPVTSRDYSAPDFQRKFSALLKEAVQRATRIIASSSYTAGQLIRHLDVPPERIRVVPLGVDPPALTLSPERQQLERERLVGKDREMILSVGVIQNLPARYRLVLAGGDGHGSEAVHAFIRDQHLEERVKVQGVVGAEQLEALYGAASVFLFPSIEEGFGLPVLEAMAHGLPVIASGTSSLPEVGGDAALYVDPNDPADLAEKVTRVCEDLALRRRLIEEGLARAGEFTWRRTAEKTLRVYDEVLSL
jgi:glycosyltransferase involved in cell wall biosynthesis